MAKVRRTLTVPTASEHKWEVQAKGSGEIMQCVGVEAPIILMQRVLEHLQDDPFEEWTLRMVRPTQSARA